MRRIVALSVLALLTLAAPAQAKKPRMTWDYAANVAVQYWAKRNVHIPCHPHPVLLTETETADWGYTPDMLADRETCAVLITPWADWRRTDFEYAWMYCRQVVHEIGHLAGLEHSYGGVMDESMNVTPRGCTRTPKARVARVGWQQWRYAQSWQP